jgi:hypothetical protein
LHSIGWLAIRLGAIFPPILIESANMALPLNNVCFVTFPIIDGIPFIPLNVYMEKPEST